MRDCGHVSQPFRKVTERLVSSITEFPQLEGLEYQYIVRSQQLIVHRRTWNQERPHEDSGASNFEKTAKGAALTLPCGPGDDAER
jgi:hypothetical protein